MIMNIDEKQKLKGYTDLYSMVYTLIYFWVNQVEI